MFKRLLVIVLLASPLSLVAMDFNVEALYGFGYLNKPQKGYLHDGSLRAIFFTESFTHEILGKMIFASDTKKSDNDAKYSGWEAEYRFGVRMDSDMQNLGMLSGSVYIGIGYQNVVQKYLGNKYDTQYIYLPLGFWGEDSSGIDALKIRYGLNFKAIFFSDDNSDQKLKFDFLFGGKVYVGVGYSIGGMMDIIAQVFFEYNAPIKNLQHYGLEVGLQF